MTISTFPLTGQSSIHDNLHTSSVTDLLLRKTSGRWCAGSSILCSIAACEMQLSRVQIRILRVTAHVQFASNTIVPTQLTSQYLILELHLPGSGRRYFAPGAVLMSHNVSFSNKSLAALFDDALVPRAELNDRGSVVSSPVSAHRDTITGCTSSAMVT